MPQLEREGRRMTLKLRWTTVWSIREMAMMKMRQRARYLCGAIGEYHRREIEGPGEINTDRPDTIRKTPR